MDQLQKNRAREHGFFMSCTQWLSRGERSMLLAVLFFTAAHTSVKVLHRIPVAEIVFFRALITLAICIVEIKRRRLPVWGNNKKILILRGLAGTAALYCYFYSVQHIPLGTAVTLQNLSPILTLILGGFLLKEKVRPLHWTLFFIAFIGVVLVRGFDGQISEFELLIALAAAFFSSLAYNYVRILSSTDHEMTVVFYYPLVTLPLIGPFAAYNWVTPQGMEWIFILAVGVFTQVAQVYMTRAYQVGPLSKVSIFSYLGVLLALLVGYFAFSETLSLIQALGVFLVLAAVIGVNRTKKLKTTEDA